MVTMILYSIYAGLARSEKLGGAGYFPPSTGFTSRGNVIENGQLNWPLSFVRFEDLKPSAAAGWPMEGFHRS